ncbi:MAG: hypothetical protein R2787_16345 [Saprospiraceae bacterium]
MCGCESRVMEGMQIQLHTPELDDHRKAMVELTFAEITSVRPVKEWRLRPPGTWIPDGDQP